MALGRRILRDDGGRCCCWRSLLAAGWSADWHRAAVNPASLTDLERQFTEQMRDVSLVGSFTIDGREGRTPREDRYDIKSVEKGGR